MAWVPLWESYPMHLNIILLCPLQQVSRSKQSPVYQLLLRKIKLVERKNKFDDWICDLPGIGHELGKSLTTCYMYIDVSWSSQDVDHKIICTLMLCCTLCTVHNLCMWLHSYQKTWNFIAHLLVYVESLSEDVHLPKRPRKR